MSGTAAVNQPGDAPVATDTTLTINTVVLNTADTDLVPLGARFTIAGEAVATVHTVTARTPSGISPTTAITFTPALGAPTTTYSETAALTFTYQQLEIKVGDGDIKYTEGNTYMYDKDRGLLDTVREGDDVPMDVSISLTFEHIKTGTGEVVTPIDALKQQGGAAEWVTSSSDTCEPYAVDVVVVNDPPCGAAYTETIVFPDFRSEKRDFDLKNATIAVSGKCNTVEPIITRG